LVRARLSEAPSRSLPAVVACLVLVVAIASLAPLFAIASPSTYTGEAPVNTQSDEERTEALKTALANVVIEETGDSGALARSDVASAVAKAERYMLQFRYKPNPAAADGGARWILVAEFDSAAVDEMLQRLGFGLAAEGGTAPLDATPSEATVWIGGIRSAEDYVRVIAYLGRSNLVRSAQPAEAHGDGMLVRLSLGTDLAHFLDAVGIERTLTVVNAAPPVEGVDATLALAP
ncbi:MAG TPA: DUF2066 domain-containing protein, partial [Rhodanobacteraceae bacterium]|nr:DUF2066 domain-containing protein [Rhodanobacteraceae bacterium]